jgi:hypothetical protein
LLPICFQRWFWVALYLGAYGDDGDFTKYFPSSFVFVCILCDWVCMVLIDKVLKYSYVRRVGVFTCNETMMLSFIITVKLQLLYSLWPP